jgi:hypothetical protein
MTVPENSAFPLGYFYIVSKLNNLVLDIRGEPENATVSLPLF